MHYGNGYGNAFWDGQSLTYGDRPNNAHPLVSLDITAHEVSHGVTDQLAPLSSGGESAGLMEAWSDIQRERQRHLDPRGP